MEWLVDGMLCAVGEAVWGLEEGGQIFYVGRVDAVQEILKGLDGNAQARVNLFRSGAFIVLESDEATAYRPERRGPKIHSGKQKRPIIQRGQHYRVSQVS